MNATRTAVLCLTVMTVLSGASMAVRTRSFLLEGPDALRAGRMNGVTIDEDGRVGPGPAAHLLEGSAGAQVWSLIRERGGSIIAATGSDGAIYRITGHSGKAIEGSFEYEVFAVVEGQDGRIFAAGAPNATISEILPDGSMKTFFDTPEKVVWALVADRSGNIYAGTGEEGALYRISPDGRGKVLYRAQDTHITALTWGVDGKLIAGTSGRGLLIEIDPASGATRVLFEAPVPEIPRVVVAPSGEIYFAAAGEPDPTAGRKDPPADEKAEVEPPPEGSRIYVRNIDGTVRQLWLSGDETVHALALDRDGNLLVGTGSAAALYRITPTGNETLLWRPEEGQVLSILPAGETIVVGTGNPGRVYELGPDNESETWLRPEPFDAKSSSSWGHAIWETLPGSGSWDLVTRSGHTQDPDSSWSAWSQPLTNPDGSAITSPPARFLQVEARYRPAGAGTPASLRRVWVAYAATNQPPQVGGIRFTSTAPGVAREARETGSYSQDLGGGLRAQFQRSQEVVAPADDTDGPPVWVRDVRTVAWDATDPDGDNMRAELGIRRVGETAFRVLARNLPTSAYAIDTATLPDGQYEVRVFLTDAPSNPPGEALTDEKIGGPFRVDHRAPAFVDLAARKSDPKTLVADGKIVDEGSPVVRLEVSWDGKPWRPAGSTDGFLDGREESFHVEIPLERDEDGRWLAMRAYDAAGNEAVGRVWLAP